MRKKLKRRKRLHWAENRQRSRGSGVQCKYQTLLSQWELGNPGHFPQGKPAATVSRYPTLINYKVHAGSFCISVMHLTLTWTTGSLTCISDHSYACVCTQGLGAVSTIYFDSGGKTLTNFSCAPDWFSISSPKLPIEPPHHPNDDEGYPRTPLRAYSMCGCVMYVAHFEMSCLIRVSTLYFMGTFLT